MHKVVQQLLSVFKGPGQRAEVEPPVSGIEAAAKAALEKQAKIRSRAEDLGVAVDLVDRRRQ